MSGIQHGIGLSGWMQHWTRLLGTHCEGPAGPKRVPSVLYRMYVARLRRISTMFYNRPKLPNETSRFGFCCGGMRDVCGTRTLIPKVSDAVNIIYKIWFANFRLQIYVNQSSERITKIQNISNRFSFLPTQTKKYHGSENNYCPISAFQRSCKFEWGSQANAWYVRPVVLVSTLPIGRSTHSLNFYGPNL